MIPFSSGKSPRSITADSEVCYNSWMRTSLLWLIVNLFALPLSVDAQELPQLTFTPSTMISIESSKKEQKRIYFQGGHNKTLHCDCMFDRQLQVHSNTCINSAKNLRTINKSAVVSWIHAMPMEKFAEALRCWNKSSCTFADGKTKQASQCCKEISPKFKSMQADMHNLFPSIMPWEENAIDSSTALFGGNQEYAFCGGSNEGDLQRPRPGIRGDIARAWFYMAQQYKLSIADDLEDQLRAWHLEDPPDAWEQERNTSIEIIQGNRNAFIDFPEAVERVINF
jgi:deoxyribonuclease-1